MFGKKENKEEYIVDWNKLCKVSSGTIDGEMPSSTVSLALIHEDQRVAVATAYNAVNNIYTSGRMTVVEINFRADDAKYFHDMKTLAESYVHLPDDYFNGVSLSCMIVPYMFDAEVVITLNYLAYAKGIKDIGGRGTLILGFDNAMITQDENESGQILILENTDMKKFYNQVEAEVELKEQELKNEIVKLEKEIKNTEREIQTYNQLGPLFDNPAENIMSMTTLTQEEKEKYALQGTGYRVSQDEDETEEEEDEI